MEGIERNKNFQANNTLKYSPDSNQLRAEEIFFHLLCNLCAIDYRAVAPTIHVEVKSFKIYR